MSLLTVAAGLLLILSLAVILAEAAPTVFSYSARITNPMLLPKQSELNSYFFRALLVVTMGVKAAANHKSVTGKKKTKSINFISTDNKD